MRIIAVENSMADLTKLQNLLGDAFPGSQCRAFCDPLLAIKAYFECPPDFTIFCKNMRIIDGFTFARTIRSYDAGFTGVILAEDESSRQDADNFFLKYLVKPVDAAVLKHCYDNIHSERENKDTYA